ncbi:MAG: hypothetical protein HY246_16115 [Proteobacteria bacterium]|nr:hypothetical protein [Pseudomonadota bacterium]
MTSTKLREHSASRAAASGLRRDAAGDPVVDKGVWATWYDLEDGRKDEFLAWMHAEYLPFLRERPGYLWVAHYESNGGGAAMRHLREKVLARPDEDVGSGTQYLMLVGAATPESFLDPSVLEPDLGGGPRHLSMLALRRGVRTGVYLEQARVTGPAPRDPRHGLTSAPAIQMGSLRMRTVEGEFDIGRWYIQLRLPDMAKTPGCIAARKYVSVAGWAKHAILYEFATLEDRMRHFEEAQEAKGLDPSHWTWRIARTTVHAPGSPMVGVRSWPAIA